VLNRLELSGRRRKVLRNVCLSNVEIVAQHGTLFALRNSTGAYKEIQGARSVACWGHARPKSKDLRFMLRSSPKMERSLQRKAKRVACWASVPTCIQKSLDFLDFWLAQHGKLLKLSGKIKGKSHVGRASQHATLVACIAKSVPFFQHGKLVGFHPTRNARISLYAPIEFQLPDHRPTWNAPIRNPMRVYREILLRTRARGAFA